MCINPNCRVVPCYNFENEKKALYCAFHKLDGMIDVKNKTCIYPGCKVLPCYNFENEKKALYCVSHKLDGMVNVKCKTCIHTGCKIRAYYNFENEKKGLYCVSHKLDGMVDVKNKTCIHTGCKIRAYYNFENEKKGLYCVSHKLDDMVDVKHKTCRNNWCFTIVTEKYEGYCLFCYMNMFPDKPVTRNYKTKEYAVVEFVKENFPDYDWKTDKKISEGCSKKRPDILLDLGYQLIIIEIDENQHIGYDCSCENKRIMELSQDVGHRPIVFIRFNPDEYTKDTKNITSCWGINKKGICVVKKTKKEEWNERLTCLKNIILYWINLSNKTTKMIEVIQLFYDE